jgi:hypothetical protein
LILYNCIYSYSGRILDNYNNMHQWDKKKLFIINIVRWELYRNKYPLYKILFHIENKY